MRLDARSQRRTFGAVQAVGRSCEACNEPVVRMGDGDACGSCDVLVCAGCLKGTARCPSCQRPFAETRSAAPSADRRGDARVDAARQEAIAVAASLAIAWGLIVMASQWTVFQTVVALAMIGLLLVELLRGRAWARWAVAGASAVYGAGMVLNLLDTPAIASPLVSLGLAAVLGVDALVLAFNLRLAQYLRAQRLRHP